jgi:hypothetical protein
MTREQRIKNIAAQEFPGCTVNFDPDSGTWVRFRIDDPTGNVLSRAFPHWHPTEVDDMTDEGLRQRIRILCGLN